MWQCHIYCTCKYFQFMCLCHISTLQLNTSVHVTVSYIIAHVNTSSSCDSVIVIVHVKPSSSCDSVDLFNAIHTKKFQICLRLTTLISLTFKHVFNYREYQYALIEKECITNYLISCNMTGLYVISIGNEHVM